MIWGWWAGGGKVNLNHKHNVKFYDFLGGEGAGDTNP